MLAGGVVTDMVGMLVAVVLLGVQLKIPVRKVLDR